jgi:hypothetical protein
MYILTKLQEYQMKTEKRKHNAEINVKVLREHLEQHVLSGNMRTV